MTKQPLFPSLRGSAVGITLATIAWILSACATTEGRGYTAESTAASPPASRVAILPIDVRVILDGMGDIEPEEEEALRAEVIARVTSMIQTELPKRGYDVGEVLGWADGKVDEQAIGDLIDGLVAHSNSVAWGNEPGGSIDPKITRYLGEQTGSGSLLYVNGSAIANTSAKKVWQGVLVVVAALAVVGTIYAASGGGGRRGGGHGHHGGHHGHSTVVVGGPVIFISSHGDPGYSRSEEPGFFDGDTVRLSATLLDSQSGEILWYADVSDGLDPRDDEDVAEYVEKIFEALPDADGAGAKAPPARKPAPPPPAPAPAAAGPAAPSAPATSAAPAAPPAVAPAAPAAPAAAP